MDRRVIAEVLSILVHYRSIAGAVGVGRGNHQSRPARMDVERMAIRHRLAEKWLRVAGLKKEKLALPRLAAGDTHEKSIGVKDHFRQINAVVRAEGFGRRKGKQCFVYKSSTNFSAAHTRTEHEYFFIDAPLTVHTQWS